VPAIIGDAALRSAFSAIEPYSSAVLAVSGGPDSMALMHLACRWLRLVQRDRSAFSVVTVDHGLRPQSREEAEFVAREAKKLGFVHATVRWTGEKPKTRIQSTARSARYDLLEDYCRSRSIPCLITAHTRDDQAETFLMRLRRGSGLDGLAAMAPTSKWKNVSVVRPLLGMSKARLIVYARLHAIPFVADPSNENLRFERARIRAAFKAFAAAGITPSALVRSVFRLQRSREALTQVAESFLDKYFKVGALAQGELPRDEFNKLPPDLALRVLARVLTLLSGRQKPLRLAKLEHVFERLSLDHCKITFGGCLIVAQGDRLRFYRESGRIGAEPTPVKPGQSVIWDGRFILTFGPKLDDNVTVRYLGAKGWITYRKELKSHKVPSEINRLAALATPALWKGKELQSAPLLGFTASRSAGLETRTSLVPGLVRFVKRM